MIEIGPNLAELLGQVLGVLGIIAIAALTLRALLR